MSFNEWESVALSEIIVASNTGLDAIKRAPIVDYDSGVKCLRIQDISQSKAFSEWGFCEVEKKNYDKFQLRKNDIIVARTGATIGVNKIIKKDLKAVYNNGLIRIKANNNLVDSVFLYYNLQSSLYRGHIQAICAGTSTQPNMKMKDLLYYRIKLPKLDEQMAIAKILSDIDQKIDTNRQISKTLENMAQSIFKQWFVDFEFPNEDGEPYKSSGGQMVDSELGMIPVGWEVVSLDDICKFNLESYGKKDNWEFIDYLDTGSITKNVIESITRFEVGNNKVPSRAKRKVINNDIVYSTVRPNQLHYGIVKNPNKNLLVSTGFSVIRNTSNYTSSELVYLYLTQKDVVKYLHGIGETSTSTYPSIKPVHIKQLKLAVSKSEEIISIYKNFEGMFNMIYQNNEENKNLGSIRDLLLPKLMSGEIRVPLEDN